MATLISLSFDAAVAVLVAGAALQDWRARTISNAWPLALLILFAIAWPLGAVAGPLGSHLIHFVLALLVGMGLFALGGIGGGDAKLYAAVALWFDLRYALYLFLCVVFAGALLALIQIGVHMTRHSGEQRTRALRQGKIAYGVAIALGTLAALARTIG